MKDSKQNCWEVRKCGREPGGGRAAELGVCPASLEQKTDGINGGINGGRACWAIAGTFCEGIPQGTLAQKIGDCLKCDFFKQVAEGEGANFEFAKGILDKLSK